MSTTCQDLLHGAHKGAQCHGNKRAASLHKHSGILPPDCHALAGTSPGTYCCQPTGHNLKAKHCWKQTQAVHKNKENWMHEQALEIPWKIYLMSDEQIAKMLKYFWEVPGPTTAPSQETDSSLGRKVMLSLAFFLCGLMTLPSFPGQIMTPHQQVKQRVPPCQFIH